jgi:hypothetical protein
MDYAMNTDYTFYMLVYITDATLAIMFDFARPSLAFDALMAMADD